MKTIWAFIGLVTLPLLTWCIGAGMATQAAQKCATPRDNYDSEDDWIVDKELLKHGIKEHLWDKE